MVAPFVVWAWTATVVPPVSPANAADKSSAFNWFFIMIGPHLGIWAEGVRELCGEAGAVWVRPAG
ncbi:exported hypothetical protein [Candidatus Sulfotelmatomonas gaucii]|uniref:Uncharacterized protein n=1 Tax=Candidatus Sulfuritelmatomonas gaucii TaxID=2043161 RepID=A0A2N9LMF6_9BACT|nr:exported hypothetical protein [Candidatus Sulfotelmatomonas gaucii]